METPCSLLSLLGCQSIFTGLAIHIGGKLRIILPQCISPIPITLHTLFASWAGMKFGSLPGTFGATIHAVYWMFTQFKAESTPSRRMRTDNNTACVHISQIWRNMFHFRQKASISLGYVVGMIPCASVAGLIVQEYHEEGYSGILFFRHPTVAATIGQMITLTLGTLWILILDWNRDNNSKHGIMLWKQFFIPFLPGLLLKSTLAWALFELTTTTNL